MVFDNRAMAENEQDIVDRHNLQAKDKVWMRIIEPKEHCATCLPLVIEGGRNKRAKLDAETAVAAETDTAGKGGKVTTGKGNNGKGSNGKGNGGRGTGTTAGGRVMASNAEPNATLSSNNTGTLINLSTEPTTTPAPNSTSTSTDLSAAPTTAESANTIIKKKLSRLATNAGELSSLAGKLDGEHCDAESTKLYNAVTRFHGFDD